MRDFCIITDCGPGLGFGHFSRMTTLLSLLISEGYDTVLCSETVPNNIPIQFKKYLVSKPVLSRTIIRDKRDSETSEMSGLINLCSVLITIDDDGNGRNTAIPIDLLPRPGRKCDVEMFIYGYEFTSLISNPSEEQDLTAKEFDLFIYSSFNEIFTYLIDKGITFISPQNGRLFMFDKNGKKYIDYRFGRGLLKSRCVITHYGLTMFECLSAGIPVGLINPTEYHSTLSNFLINDYELNNIKNLGTENIKTSENAEAFINSVLSEKEITKSLPDIQLNIKNKHKNIMSRITGL